MSSPSSSTLWKTPSKASAEQRVPVVDRKREPLAASPSLLSPSHRPEILRPGRLALQDRGRRGVQFAAAPQGLRPTWDGFISDTVGTQDFTRIPWRQRRWPLRGSARWLKRADAGGGAIGSRWCVLPSGSGCWWPVRRRSYTQSDSWRERSTPPVRSSTYPRISPLTTEPSLPRRSLHNRGGSNRRVPLLNRLLLAA